MNQKAEPKKVGATTTASSADFGSTTDNVQVKIPDTVIDKQIEKRKDNVYSEERQCSVFLANIPSFTISVNITVIKKGSNDRKHRHYYETLMFILDGRGHSVIEGEKVEWEAGDALHIPPWSWHQHFNGDPEREIRYLAATNAPLLQNVGGIAKREEAG
ncbi:MAG: cupin domain-containing protein [Candidatus Anammoxibacter sp.]